MAFRMIDLSDSEDNNDAPSSSPDSPVIVINSQSQVPEEESNPFRSLHDPHDFYQYLQPPASSSASRPTRTARAPRPAASPRRNTRNRGGLSLFEHLEVLLQTSRELFGSRDADRGRPISVDTQTDFSYRPPVRNSNASSNERPRIPFHRLFSQMLSVNRDREFAGHDFDDDSSDSDSSPFIPPRRHHVASYPPAAPRRARRRRRRSTLEVPPEFRHLQGGPPIELEESDVEAVSPATPERNREDDIREKAKLRWRCKLQNIDYVEKADEPLTDAEISQALPFLLNRFSRVTVRDVEEKLKQTRSYVDAYRQLEEMWKTNPSCLIRSKRKMRECSQRPSKKLKRQLDAPEVEAKVKFLLDQFALERQAAVEEGKNMQCGCCFDDELTETEILKCSEGHMFCFACVRQTAETFFAEGLYASEPGKGNWRMCVVKCMKIGGCEGSFTEAALQAALPPASYIRYSQRALALSAAIAQVEDLVFCPWCDFVVSMPNKNDSVVVCHNPSCGKKSCRYCKQKSHLPLRCDEIEKDWEVEMRTKMEEAINDEVSRKCPKCKKLFEKTEGCNHMTCVCGTNFCYLCGDVIRKNSMNADGSAYHYGRPPKCDQFGKMSNAKRKRVIEAARKAGIAARDRYLEEHPQHKGKKLKNCPIEALKVKKEKTGDFHAEAIDDR